MLFCPDDWMTALGIDLFDQETRAKVEALQWQLAQELLALGQTVIIYLEVPIDLLLERLDARNVGLPYGTTVITRENLLSWVDSFEAPDAEEQARFDSDGGLDASQRLP